MGKSKTTLNRVEYICVDDKNQIDDIVDAILRILIENNLIKEF